MSTRSNIGILSPNGEVTMIYCHFDGYPSNNGKILLENYKTEDQVLDLIVLGDLSELGPTTTKTVAYARDRGEKINEAFTFKDISAAINYMQEYLYLFDTANKKWVYSDHREPIADLTIEICTRR